MSQVCDLVVKVDTDLLGERVRLQIPLSHGAFDQAQRKKRETRDNLPLFFPHSHLFSTFCPIFLKNGGVTKSLIFKVAYY